MKTTIFKDISVRTGRRLLVGAAVALCLFSGAGAQRLVDRLVLEDPDLENFIFDLNSIPVSTTTNEQSNPSAGGFSAIDLNIAPNVVYSPDSSRGFVAVAGTNRIVVFSPAEATVETTLEVPDNPLLASLTPDGSTAVFVSLEIERNQPRQGAIFGDRVGAISAVDVETLEVRTLQLQEVLFSVGNNVVFSADGQTGFVASMGTDEIVRFDVATLTETGRLSVQEGSRPASLTMAPNGQFFTAVLIGSNNLDRLTFPDSVAVIDVAGFTQLRTVAPQTGPDQPDTLLHNFVVYNNMAISADSRLGVIAEQQASLTSLIPAITPDRAFVLDLETGETIASFFVSGVASGSYLSPTGRVAIISELQVTVVNIDDETTRALAPLGSAFRPSTRPLFVGDEMWVASPITDTLNVVDMATGEISRVISVGGRVIRGEGAAAREVPSAPLDLTRTPDGSRMTLVNFNSTVLDFVEDTERLMFPRVLGAEGFFTGVAVTNVSEEDSSLILLGHQLGGPLFPDQAPNRVFNSNFSNGTLLWTVGEGWSIGSGVATAANASSELSQDVAVVDGELYEVSFTVSNYTGGTITAQLGGTDGTARSDNGTFTELIMAGDGTTPRLRLIGAGFSGDVDDITVRLEITRFDNPGVFDLPTGTQLAQTETEWLMPTAPIDIEGWFDFDSTTPITGLEIMGDTLLRRMDGAVGFTRTGQRWILPEVRIDPAPFPNLVVNSVFTTDFGWTPGDGWVIADGAATATTASTGLTQNISEIVEGTSYRVKFTISNFEGGTLTPVLGGTMGTARAADGVFEEILVAGDGGDPTLELVGAEFSGTVDEVTVVENTPLPPAEGINTEVTLINPNRNSVSAVLQLFSNSGDLVSSLDLILPASGGVSNFIRDPDPDSFDINGFFPEGDLIGFEGGYVVATTNTGLLAIERYLTNQRMSLLPGFIVDNPTATRLVGPQVLAFGDTRSFVTLVSSLFPPPVEEGEDPVEGDSIDVQLSLMGNDGQVVAGPVDLTLAPRERIRRDVVDLFDLQDPGNGQLISAWLLVETDIPGLVGDVELQLFSQKAMTTIPLQTEAATDLTFSHIVQGLGLLTGLSLVNPDEEDATVTIEVFRREGDLVDSTTLPLAAGSRLSELFEEIFPDLPELTGGFVRISSDRPLFAVELFFATNTQFLATVPAQIVSN